MKSRTLVVSLLTAWLMLWAAQSFAQSAESVGNSKNPPAFQKFNAPVSARLAFLASEKGKQALLASPNPLARDLLLKYHGEDAAALWDKIPHKYATSPSSSESASGSPAMSIQQKATPLPKGTPSPATPTSRCPATRFNLEAALGALPQNTETIDFKLGGGSTSGSDMMGEGANDFRGLYDPPGVFTPSLSGYYFQPGAGCTPGFEGALPPIPDPFFPANRMWGTGSPILNYDANHDAWFYSSVFEDSSSSGVGIFRNTTTNLKNSLTCVSGTHNLIASISCWPLGPTTSGYYAAVLDPVYRSEYYYIDSPDSWVDSRTTGTGAGNVYLTDTYFDYGYSYIHLMTCTNTLTSCYSGQVISGNDYFTQFSDVKTTPSGNITVTYGNYTTQITPSDYRYISEVDIKYVVCTPNGAPSAPSCSYPVLVASEWQPVNTLTTLPDVENRTVPVHVETPNGTYVFWERCGSLSDLPFGGLEEGGWICPDADIVGAFSNNGGTSWTAPFVVDNAFGHQIQPAASYDSSADKIIIAYQDCDAFYKAACRVGYREITPSGGTTVSAFNPLSSYAFPEADANAGWFDPLDGSYIGVSAHGGHMWMGYTDTLRKGTYGYGTEQVGDSNNNVAAVDNP